MQSIQLTKTTYLLILLHPSVKFERKLQNHSHFFKGDFLRPFPNKARIDVTSEMKKQNWTPKTMFEKAEEFFVSMGLEPMKEVRIIKGLF